ncbi:restriction endonuclease subunit S [Corynebacterium phoceense]|uniref:restriction endonuclease subunit S n=1 Tax=Corynebacterium phoceense TaxID=1686286 RepID=UPI00211BC765|nr:restriction endonuclease subunit S [Corynebacterium phoceense]MCQ9341907.1 restriction endonuclease subunit S [Corynebacterium phoceense]
MSGDNLVKLGHLARFGNGQDWKKVAADDGEFPVYGSGGQFGWASDFLHDGEAILFGRKGTVDHPIYVDGKFWTVDTMYYAVPNTDRCRGKYLYYWATTIPFKTIATNTALPSVTSMDLSQLYVPLPPFETQQRIADYLDRETAEIDAAVADLDRYVKLLEKRGKVLIEKTVNGGTYSFSPLWSKIRVQNGFAFDSEKFSPTKELPVAKIGNVLPGDFSEFIDASELPSESFLIKDGDLVVGMSGDFNRTIWNKGKAALNQRVCILKPIADDDIRYINYAIGSGLKKIHSTKFSTTLKNLSTEEILAIRVPHRTVTEQKEIATYLDKETAEINDLVVESTRLRDLLLKRRSVLIAEVVTGRKQV